MGAGVVERARLESVFGLKANAGSNPAPSASFLEGDRMKIRFGERL
jgi:hypothetical protein